MRHPPPHDPVDEMYLPYMQFITILVRLSIITEVRLFQKHRWNYIYKCYEIKTDPRSAQH